MKTLTLPSFAELRPRAEEDQPPAKALARARAHAQELCNLLAKDFDPDKHPRDEAGRFSESGGGEGLLPEHAVEVTVHPLSELPDFQAEKIAAYAEKRGLTYDSAAEQARSYIDRAKQTGAFDQGMGWYDRMAAQLEGRAQAMGIDPEKYAGMVAGLSPHQRWELTGGQLWNMDLATRLNDALTNDREFEVDQRMIDRFNTGKEPYDLSEYRGTVRASEVDDSEALARIISGSSKGEADLRGLTLFPNIEKAIEIYRGGDPDDVLSGNKVRSFYNALVTRGDSDATVIDSHMMGALTGKIVVSQGGLNQPDGYIDVHTLDNPRPGIKDQAAGADPNGTTYALLDQVTRDVADEYGLRVSDAQAIIWSQHLLEGAEAQQYAPGYVPPGEKAAVQRHNWLAQPIKVTSWSGADPDMEFEDNWGDYIPTPGVREKAPARKESKFYDPDKHPRGEDGRWTDAGGGVGILDRTGTTELPGGNSSIGTGHSVARITGTTPYRREREVLDNAVTATRTVVIGKDGERRARYEVTFAIPKRDGLYETVVADKDRGGMITEDRNLYVVENGQVRPFNSDRDLAPWRNGAFKEWDPDLHPRDEGGKFSSTGGSGDPPVARGSTLDEVLRNMGAHALEGGRDAHPEQYMIHPRSGFSVRNPEVPQTTVIHNPEGGPVRIHDTLPGPLGMREQEIEGTARPPDHVFRAVSEEEYQLAKERGYLQSDQRMNLSQTEGTVADLGNPSFYLPGRLASSEPGDYPGRIVRIDYHDEDGWRYDPIDGYVKTNDPIPFERISMVSPVITTVNEGRRISTRVESKDFDPEKHPRDDHGRFAEAGGGIYDATIITGEQIGMGSEQLSDPAERARVTAAEDRISKVIADGASIDLSRADPAAAELTADRIEKFAATFPSAARSLLSVEVGDTDFGTAAFVERVEGTMLEPYVTGSRLTLSDHVVGPDSEEGRQVSITNAFEAGWHPYDNMEGLIDHELGHVLGNWIKAEEGGSGPTQWMISEASNSTAQGREERLQWMADTFEGLGGISGYAFRGGPSEAFAEAYALWSAGRVDELSDTMENLVERAVDAAEGKALIVPASWQPGAVEPERTCRGYFQDHYPGEDEDTKDFDPDKHPKDEHGRWATTGAATAMQEALRDSGGFTVDPHTGASPTTGYQVAIPGHALDPLPRVDDVLAMNDDEFGQLVEGWINDNAEAFEGDAVYVGGWEQDGRLYLEPSEHIEDRDEAVAAGVDRGQAEIYDNATGETIRTGDTAAKDLREAPEALVADDTRGTHGVLTRSGPTHEGRLGRKAVVDPTRSRTRERIINRAEAQLAGVLRAYLQRQKRVALERLKGPKTLRGTRHYLTKAGDRASRIERKLDPKNVINDSLWRQQLMDDTHPLMVDLYDEIGSDTLADVGRTMGVEFGDFDPELPTVAESIAARTNLIGDASDTLTERVRTLIADGEERGLSIGEIGDEIEALYDDLDAREGWADRLAADEIHGGQMAAAHAAVEASGLKGNKSWITVGDERVRPTHERADTQTVAIDEKFQVGNDELMYPHDENGSPEETVNCRCQVLWDLTQEEEQQTEAASLLPGMAGQLERKYREDQLRDHGRFAREDGGDSSNGEKPEWKPVMTPAEAEKWNADSKFTGDVYHATRTEAAERIAQGGFDPARSRSGYLGAGTYFTPGRSDFTTQWYRGETDGVVSAKINIDSPLKVDATKSTNLPESLAEALGPEHGRELLGWLDSVGGHDFDSAVGTIARPFVEKMQEWGYDSIVLHAQPFQEVLGDQIVVFDPHDVVVTGRLDSREIPRTDEPLLDQVKAALQRAPQLVTVPDFVAQLLRARRDTKSLELKYRDDQSRDDHGRWSEEGGGGGRDESRDAPRAGDDVRKIADRKWGEAYKHPEETKPEDFFDRARTVLGETTVSEKKFDAAQEDAIQALKDAGYHGRDIADAIQMGWGAGTIYVKDWQDRFDGGKGKDLDDRKTVDEIIDLVRHNETEGDIWRGVALSKKEVGDLEDRVGKKIDSQLTSWSRERDVAKVFSEGQIEGKQNQQVLFHISDPVHGLDIAPLGQYQYAWQNEVMVGEEELRVTGMNEKGGIPVFEMEPVR